MESLISFLDFEFIQFHQPIFLACSGGRDSMALAHILLQNQIPFEILHVNFQLRGLDSDQDEEFVKVYCTQNGIPFHSKKVDTQKLATQNKNSIEIEARNQRYAFFEEKSKPFSNSLVLTAHHHDDQLETILIKLIKGSGIDGLKGIPKLRDNKYFRPLLTATQNQINDYIEQNQLKYREDSSNSNTLIMRNRIRHDVIPILKELNPNLQEALTHLTTEALNYASYIEEIASPYLFDMENNHEINISSKLDERLLPSILYFVFKHLSPNRTQIRDLAKSLKLKESKKIQLGDSFFEVKNGKMWNLKNLKNLKSLNISDLKELLKCQLFEIDLIDKPAQFNNLNLYVDLDRVNFPLTIRSLQVGDYFKPLGMKGKSKKVADFLQSLKMTTTQKQLVPIVEDSNGIIIWVGGFQISEHVKITEKTKQILKIKSI